MTAERRSVCSSAESSLVSGYGLLRGSNLAQVAGGGDELLAQLAHFVAGAFEGVDAHGGFGRELAQQLHRYGHAGGVATADVAVEYFQLLVDGAQHGFVAAGQVLAPVGYVLLADGRVAAKAVAYRSKKGLNARFHFREKAHLFLSYEL